MLSNLLMAVVNAIGITKVKTDIRVIFRKIRN